MQKIFLVNEQKEIFCQKGENLHNVLTKNNISLYAPCGGKGVCGKCKVIIENTKACDEEKKFLSKEEIESSVRLACKVEVCEDMVVKTYTESAQILEKSSIVLPKEFDEEEGIGFAVDIGTTTIAVCLVNLKTGEPVATKACLNSQSIYGGDVVSRIENSLKPGVLELLKKSVLSDIDSLIKKLCKDNGFSKDETEKIVITGNTAMLHLALGLDTNCLAKAPFSSPIEKTVCAMAEELFENAGSSAKVYFMPPIGAFVGSDITAGILATKLYESEEYEVLIDIGTNGEIVVGKKGEMYASATAAGPAFEGASISCGSAATDGAIDTVKVIDGKLKCSVLGGGEAKSICGSGIIDAVAAMLEVGILDETGYMDEDKCYLTENVFIESRDVREIQLAKAAIAAGVLTLSKEYSIDLSNAKSFYLAGGFGKFLNVKSASTIGLIPKEISDKAVAVGNTSLLGAIMALRSEKMRGKLESLAKEVNYVKLSGNPKFNEIYMDEMCF